MKITEARLRTIIREELERVMLDEMKPVHSTKAAQMVQGSRLNRLDQIPKLVMNLGQDTNPKAVLSSLSTIRTALKNSNNTMLSTQFMPYIDQLMKKIMSGKVTPESEEYSDFVMDFAGQLVKAVKKVSQSN
jgi:hypothetical protein